jgi:hypothetical protein
MRSMNMGYPSCVEFSSQLGMGVHPLTLQRFARVLLFGCLLCTAGNARSANPYRAIIDRNVFGLRPLLQTKAEPPRAPLPKITLTGITTLLKGKRALLKVQVSSKPPQKEQSYILAEGQREGPIQVLEINEKTAQVKLDSYGTITNITFEKITNNPRKPFPASPARPRYFDNPQLYRRATLPRPRPTG